MESRGRSYGCTFAGCTKILGNRNDWRRHESSQHELQEQWWCRHCKHTTRSLEGLTEHWILAHNIPQEPSQRAVNENVIHLGPHGQNFFWCGFCQQCVRQVPGVLEAWQYRMKHIGDHFENGKCGIEDWIDPARMIEDKSMEVALA